MLDTQGLHEASRSFDQLSVFQKISRLILLLKQHSVTRYCTTSVLHVEGLAPYLDEQLLFRSLQKFNLITVFSKKQ